MPRKYLHQLDEFPDLIRIVSEEFSIDPVLIEKDYWIMHCLHGLQRMDLSFELKGGTSLSKGYGIIERFSEDIDIRIEPPAELQVATNPNQRKPVHTKSRRGFYDWLASNISISGVVESARDTAFDDPSGRFRSGGVRLHYGTHLESLAGLKDGILLEVGFDLVTPNCPRNISSWAYDFAADKVDVIDNRAINVPCYHPGYTFVEKLQTISTKFRRQQDTGEFPVNFMRHYYDVYRLLAAPQVLEFVGTPEYAKHKKSRFRGGDNPNLRENEAFLLSNPETYALYEKAYKASRALYYRQQPEFSEIVQAIRSAGKFDGI